MRNRSAFQDMDLFWTTTTILCAAVLSVSCDAVRIPPRDRTLRTINKTSIAIGHFYRAHNRLPTDLNEVDIPHPCVDSWDRPIIYTLSGTNAYVLMSYGESGRSGGDAIARMFDADDINTISSRRINP